MLRCDGSRANPYGSGIPSAVFRLGQCCGSVTGHTGAVSVRYRASNSPGSIRAGSGEGVVDAPYPLTGRDWARHQSRVRRCVDNRYFNSNSQPEALMGLRRSAFEAREISTIIEHK